MKEFGCISLFRAEKKNLLSRVFFPSYDLKNFQNGFQLCLTVWKKKKIQTEVEMHMKLLKRFTVVPFPISKFFMKVKQF